MSEIITPNDELILPPGVKKITEKIEDGERSAKQLPIPTGYKMLVALPDIEETYESGLVKAELTLQAEEVTTVVAFVLEMGPDCYADKAKFPTGPWCKKGDFVILRAYSGTRIKVHGKEFRLINDDSVEAVVEDPRGITRAG